ncbi:hypothetical protein JQ608_28190 [Bradyrhizobium liaoningense]|jgi:ATP-dependent Zn protease|uniref:hypothetical protein n=1 Tax=Bradyrhizobium liaoningense TaxID=43992 RepID=UPI001BAA9E92|nr:hypothetical protein [Bradyrhizobium liaoningense]MBR0880982.1 hypothetical protein [Bradyrhizobium liaoningense]
MIELGNPYYGDNAADLSQDDAFTLAGITMCGPGMGKAIRERMGEVAYGIMRKYGPRAFEMPKRAAAIHEAGHVVINATLGIRNTLSLIDQKRGGDGQPLWFGFTDVAGDELVDTPDCPASFEDILTRARAVYAGIAAEDLLAGDDRREASSLDEVMMSQILAERAADLNDRDAEPLWQKEVVMWCQRQIAANQEAHQQIVAALLARKRLKGKQLRELCSKVRPVQA